MKLAKRIGIWVELGLITAEQAAAIGKVEAERNQGRFGNALVGLSLLAIVVGVLAVIAANWHVIPGEVKILAHFLLNALVAAGILWATRSGRLLEREGGVFVFAGLTLTLIALVGQVFQVDGTLAGALLLWVLIITPMVFAFGATLMTAIPWLLALIVTLGINAVDWAEEVGEFEGFLLIYGLALLVPLGLASLGRLQGFAAAKPRYADVMVKAGFVLLIIHACAGSVLWYTDRLDLLSEGDTFAWSRYFGALAVPAIVAAGFAVHVGLRGAALAERDARTLIVLAAVSAAMLAVPFMVPWLQSDVIGAVAFVAYWLFVGWCGQRMGRPRIASLAIVAIAIRIFIIYAEALGSLMMSGFGLISGGIVMLLLIWVARRLNREFVKGAKP